MALQIGRRAGGLGHLSDLYMETSMRKLILKEKYEWGCSGASNQGVSREVVVGASTRLCTKLQEKQVRPNNLKRQKRQ